MDTDFKFIHCADLHLGSRFSGITSRDADLGRRLTESVFSSFRKIVDMGMEEDVDFMVISGDIFDEENETPLTRFRFTEEVRRFGKPCFISLGNHDHRRSWESSIPLPENAHLFPTHAENVILDIRSHMVEIAGISFPTRHTSENLAATLHGSPNMFSIGVVHCSLDSFSDDRYAPCRSSDLLGRGIDYWALGHIHTRAVIEKRPHIVYSGNIQGMNRNESGERGAYLVSVNDNAVSDLRFIATQGVLWTDVTVDISGKNMEDMMRDISSQIEKGSILSISFTGTGELDAPLRLNTEELREGIATRTGCIVSSMELGTSPPFDVESMSKGNDLFAAVIRSADDLHDMGREKLIDLICSTKTSKDIRYLFESLSDEELKSISENAKMLILERLMGVSR